MPDRGACREERVGIGDAELWTATSGRGPGLVLVHGGPGMSDNLGALGRMVDDLATVHRYDQRACGRSTGRSTGQTVESAIADLDALREHWAYDRWTVGGHSWGATLALLYALAHPDRTNAVVYISGTGVTPPPHRQRARPRLDRLTRAEQHELENLDRPDRSGDPGAATRVAHLLWRTDFSDPDKAPDFTVDPLFAYPRNVAAGRALRRSLDERVRAGLADEVGRLRMPVLVLHGDDDPFPVECATDLADRLQRAHLTVLAGVGHNPWLEDAPAVRTALRHFLDLHADGSPHMTPP